MSVTVACSAPRCPRPAHRKGKCRVHAPRDDGYAPDWRATSLRIRQARRVCERCGTGRDLTVDHIIPGSLAGGLRVLCRSCHATVGAKRYHPGRPSRDPAA